MTLAPIHRMECAPVNGVELEYEIRGTGEPVLLIHGSHISGSFVPLMNQHVLTDNYALIRYHRRGFAGSQPARGAVSIKQQADDARALLEYLRVGPAHVVGHSYGGAVALQLAVDSPDSMASLILFEPGVLTVEGGQQVFDLVDFAAGLYRDGEWEAAVDLFLGSPRERADITRNVPGGLEGAVRDVDTYFTVEAPAHEEWVFGKAEGTRIKCPVLSMLGAESNQLYRNVHDQLLQWMPQMEKVVLPGATHLLMVQQPAGAAALLAEFLAGHPVGDPAAGRRARRRAVAWLRPDTERYNATVDLLDGNLEAGRSLKVAIRTPDRDLTYAEVVAGANRVGNALRGLGVRQENRVLLAVADSAEFATAFFGAIKIGAVPVPVSTALSADEYAYLLDDARARAVIFSESAATAMRQARDRVRHLEHVVIIGEPGAGERSLAELTSCAGTELTAADTTREDIAFILYSSGTGGRPKGIVHLQDAMRACAEAYGRTVLNLDESDVTYSIPRLHHAYGLGAGLYFPFAAGATTVLSPVPPQPRSVLHTIRGYRPTVLFGVPSSYASILAAGGSRLKADAFDSLRLCISSGEPLAASLLEGWRDATGLDIVEGVGSTESCHIYISNRADDIRPGSSGTLVNGYLARVVGKDGRELPRGEPGRLLVTGGSLFAGYWRRRELTRRTMFGEWLDTGDVYLVDEAGYFTFQGRADDMLKVAGTWVSPAEVEAVLVETGLVDECAVVGVQDAFSLVRLMAFVVPRGDGDDYEELERVLRQEVRQRLGNSKTPRVFRFVDELPRTDKGTVHRSPLREQARVAPTG